jgi:enoyl-CoA hydratase/carnithine racemase
MHCDLIIAGESARFGQPEVKLGLMPGAGGTQRLIRAVGKFQAMRIALTGCLVTAPEALKIGLVSEVVSDDQTLLRAHEIAAEIAALPPLAVAQIKEVILAGADLPLEAALVIERKAFQLLFDSQDQKEGAAAFLEKRAASFKGE